MDPTSVPAEAVAAAHDMSFIGLFLQADPIVKSVMILLVVASLACWTVVFEKIVRLSAAKRQAKAFDAMVRSEGTIDTGQKGIAGHVVKAGLDAWRDQDPSESRAERRERIERAMKGALSLEVKRLQGGLPLLATSGSTAPFVGLFGTVWGIMTAFTSIAASKNTSLAVVAPGIAEALFATAIGLFAAIPAVLAYNKLQATVSKSQSRLEGFADEFSAILSRQIDERLSVAA